MPHKPEDWVAHATFGIGNFQFLNTKSELMFMKPKYAKVVADSLEISLNYKAAPDWSTYQSLQAVSRKLDAELRLRGLQAEFGMMCKGSCTAR